MNTRQQYTARLETARICGWPMPSEKVKTEEGRKEWLDFWVRCDGRQVKELPEPPRVGHG